MDSLIFVYNAKSDIIHLALDFAHKIIQPSTYACNLCKLTHGTLKEKSDWKEFKKNTETNLEFYHMDEFEDLFPAANSYPVIYYKEELELTELLSTKMLSTIESTQELINVINQKLT